MNRFTLACLMPLAALGFAPPAAAQPVLNPTPFAFGDVTVGGISAARVFTLDNPGPDPITIVSVGLGGFAPEHYVLGTNTCAGIVAVAGSCSASVTFSPDATGNQVALLRIVYTSPSMAGNAELDATLSGVGVMAPAAPAQPVPMLGNLSLIAGALLLLAGAWLSREHARRV